MRLFFQLFLYGFFIILFCRCSMNKDSYLKDFENFITKAEKSYVQASDQEWEKMQAQFYEYSEKYFEQFKKELDVNEKIAISVLKTKFSSLNMKRESKKLLDQMKAD